MARLSAEAAITKAYAKARGNMPSKRGKSSSKAKKVHSMKGDPPAAQVFA